MPRPGLSMVERQRGLGGTVRGAVADGLESVGDELASLSRADPTYCAQFVVYSGGEAVVDLVCGDWLGDSLIPVFSVGKGAIGVTIAWLLEHRLVDLDSPVAEYWPEFAAAGKARITVGELLSHQAGLAAIDGGFDLEELFCHERLAARLAAQRPLWHVGAGFAYHALTIATLCDELVRRVTGRPLGQVFDDEVARPRSLDVYLGVPSTLDRRVVRVESPTAAEMEAAASELPVQAGDGLSQWVLPRDLGPVWDVVNGEKSRRVGQAAVSGLATAKGLAGMYASLAHPVGGAARLVGDDVISQVSQLRVDGPDLLSGVLFRYGALFQRSVPPRLDYGSWWAFGHDGMGGSVGVHDPYYGLSFGYTVRRIAMPPRCDSRALDLMRRVRDLSGSAGLG